MSGVTGEEAVHAGSGEEGYEESVRTVATCDRWSTWAQQEGYLPLRRRDVGCLLARISA